MSSILVPVKPILMYLNELKIPLSMASFFHDRVVVALLPVSENDANEYTRTSLPISIESLKNSIARINQFFEQY